MTASNHGSSNEVVEPRETGKCSEKGVEETSNANGKVKEKTKSQKSPDSIEMHVVGHDENVTLQVIDADSISKVRLSLFLSRSSLSLRLTLHWVIDD